MTFKHIIGHCDFLCTKTKKKIADTGIDRQRASDRERKRGATKETAHKLDSMVHDEQKLNHICHTISIVLKLFRTCLRVALR